jgi:hypothetical protein
LAGGIGRPSITAAKLGKARYIAQHIFNAARGRGDNPIPIHSRNIIGRITHGHSQGPSRHDNVGALRVGCTGWQP